MNNVPKSSTAPVVMDARKFVRLVNSSAAAKLKFFEESVAKMGKSVNKNLRLTSLDSSNVIYEDVDKNTFYIADIKKGGRGKVHLENVRPIQIVEEDKASQYQKNVRDLVDNICEGKLTQADKIFNKIESQRFRSKVIPESGWITLKDGVARHVPVSTRIVKEDHASNIIRLFTEAVRDTVEVDQGRIIRGTLSEKDQKFIIPINEYTRRRLVAHKMKEAANTAYKSAAFQNLAMECAALVCEGKIDNAVKLAAKFLKEEQEFCLLSSKEVKALIENTLATRAQFNPMLAKDVSNLFYKTNLKINRSSILEAWTKMAQKSEAASLLTNVNILSESKDFENDYDKFLGLIFNEEMDIQTARAKAYRTTLRVIASILPDLEDEEGEEVSASVDELNELIERLSGSEPDTDAVLQAEELLAGISDSLIDSVQDLEGFDAMPGEEEEGMEGEEEEGDLVPLPEVGGEEEEEEGMEGMEGEEGLPAPEEEEEGPPLPPMESIQRRLVPVEKMTTSNLSEELEDWKLHGNTFLNEHGYDQCSNDMDRYIKRCIELGPVASNIRESFENMRSRMVNTGAEVLADLDDDPYSESFMAALNGSDKLLESNDPKDPERDPAFWGDKESELSFEERINQSYRHTFLEGDQPWELSGGISDASGLRMDDLRGGGGVADKNPTKSDGRGAGGQAAGYHAPQKGSGVAKKGVKPVDGRKGESSTSGSVSGSTRMDDKQGGGGVQSQGVSSTDGRKGRSTSSQKSESTVAAHGGVPGTDLSMGSDFQGKGGVVPKSLKSGSGASGDGAPSAKKYEASGGLSGSGHDMSEFQGGDGVEDDSLDADPHKGQGKVKSDGGLKASSKGGDMAGSQGGGGVAEALTPERIAALISEMEDLNEEVCAKCKKADCPCGCAGDAEKCKCEAVSEEAMKGKCDSCGKPNFICRGKCGGGSDDDSDDSSSDDDSGSSSDSDDSDDKFPKSENQYKGPTRKYPQGYKKSSISQMEAVERVAAFIGSPDSVAAAVDQALSGLEDDMDLGDEMPMGDEMMPMGDEAGPPEMDMDDLGGDEDLGDDLGAPEPEDDSDLEGALDDALGGVDETDEVAAEGSSDGYTDPDSEESESDESESDESEDETEE